MGFNDESETTDSPWENQTNKTKHAKVATTLLGLFRFAKRLDYVLMVLGCLTGVAQGILCSAASAVIFRHLSDTLIQGQIDWSKGTFVFEDFKEQALVSVISYASFGLLIFLLSVTSMSCWHTLCERQIKVIREKYLEAVLRQDMKWFDQHHTGELTVKMSEGMDRIKDGIGDKLGAILNIVAMFIAGLAVAFYMSWKLTLIILAFIPLYFGPAYIASRIMKRMAPKEQKATGSAAAVADEVIGGIRTVMAFNGQSKEIKRYGTLLNRLRKLGVARALLTAIGTSFMIGMLFVSLAFSFYVGSLLVVSGEVSAGTTFAVFWSIMGCTFFMGSAVANVSAIQSARVAAKDVFDIIDRVPEIDSASRSGSYINTLKGDIAFKNVHFAYPSRSDVPILKGVSITISKGEHVAFVGHSGCGKTTLMALLLRYYDQSAGEVRIDGVDVREINLESLRSMIGTVSQEPALFSDTIENNLRLGNPELTDEEMIRIARMANAHGFIMKLENGYNSYVGDGGVKLSGGQKQRIAIARALARNPQILLLDEATSALDTESESIVQYALERAQQGRTTISIAHRLSTIKNADCIYVFEKGIVVEYGKHDELMAKNGHYTKLVRAQEIEKQTKKGGEEEPDSTESALARASIQHFSPNRARLSRRLSKAVSGAGESLVEADIEGLEEELKEQSSSTSSLLTILKFARKEWWMLIVGLIFAIARGLTFPIFSIIYGRMFQVLANDTASEDIMHGALVNGLAFVALGVFAGFTTLSSGFLFGRAGEHLTMRLRIALFTNIVMQDGAYFDKMEHSPGRLTTRLATDAPNIRAAIDQRLADVLQAVSAIVAATAIAFYYGPTMAPIGVATALSLIGLQTAITQYLKRKGQKDAVKAEEPARVAVEAIELHKTVACLTREKHFLRVFQTGMAGVHRRTLSRGILTAVTYGLSVSFVYMNFAIAYAFAIWLISIESATPFSVFQVIEALNVASLSVISFATYFPEYVRARMSAALLFHMLGIEPEIDCQAEHAWEVDLSGDVQLNHVVFAYPANKSQLVLKDMNLHVAAGQSIALVGPSGCGKSTIIQLLERFYDPKHGMVMFDGIDAQELNLRHVRNQISLVQQEPTLFNYTIRENIAYGCPGAERAAIEAAARLANAHDFITSLPLGYETPVGEKGSLLSGGQKQRIAIARAAIREPKILLLDEATSALDTESEKIVQEALDKARAGRTSIVVAHRLSTVQNSDFIAVCEGGKIAEMGTHQELLAMNGLYVKLIEKQSLD